MARVSLTFAAHELASRDRVIAGLVEAVGPPRFRPPAETHFAALVRAVAFQQLAGAAATAIHGRVVDLLDGQVTPSGVLGIPETAMRAAGLSAAKTASIRDLATKTLDGTVILEGRGLSSASDEDVITRLSSVRGIGRWTAEMFLLFQLRRLDVWPTGDLGVRRGYSVAYRIAMPSPRQLESLGDKFRPYRSVAAWYCWRAVERARTGVASAVTT